MTDKGKIIARINGVIDAVEEVRAEGNERLTEQAMIVAYLRIKVIMDEEGAII